MERRRSRSGGLTLIEFAASVAVVAVALVGTAAAIAAGADMSRATQQTRAASRAAATIMEQVRSTPFDQLIDQFDGRTDSVLSVGSDGSATSSVTVTEEDNGSTRWKVYKVAITTSWKGVAGNQSMTVVTYVSDRREGGALSGGTTTVPAEGTYQ